ncbi:hypothetical protein N0V95_006836 [Ascochyta clinopodiicola]|nr:hypothetical protein N0V95_006836 [Ascochyta clinopodiicola]
MAEVLGLVASVIQVAGAGVQLSKTLYDYVDGVATADRRIKDIASEIKMTSIVIEELGDVFKHEETASLMSKKAVMTANDTIKECSALFAQIDATLKKSKKNAFGRLILPFRDSKLELLRSHVDKLKSTLQLLMQVLTHAYQVASRKLDRAAEERQREEIRHLLEKKDQSTKKHDDLLRRDSASTDITLVDGDELSATSDPVMAASTINSTITVQSLATCVDHVRNLLAHIETLQNALAATEPGGDHSEHHQNLVDSYFRTRGHLDEVMLGSSKHKLYSSTTGAVEVQTSDHAVKQRQLENERLATKDIRGEEQLAPAKTLNMLLRSATKQESQAINEDVWSRTSENVIDSEWKVCSGPSRELSVALASDGNPKVTEHDKTRQRRRCEQSVRQDALDPDIAANLTREENKIVISSPSREQARNQQEQKAYAANMAAAGDTASTKPTDTLELPVHSRKTSIPVSPTAPAKRQHAVASSGLKPRNERPNASIPEPEEQLQRQRIHKTYQPMPMSHSRGGGMYYMPSRPSHGQYHPKLPSNDRRTMSGPQKPCVAASYNMREYTPSPQERDTDSAVDELLKEWTTVLG